MGHGARGMENGSWKMWNGELKRIMCKDAGAKVNSQGSCHGLCLSAMRILPCEFKDYAKGLRARFDPSVKKWYAPVGCDLAPLNDLGMLPCAVAETFRTCYAAVRVATRVAKCEQTLRFMPTPRRKQRRSFGSGANMKTIPHGDYESDKRQCSMSL